MIVSHKHKFIFLKTRKTAGTSVEVILSRFCGPDDIITPISDKDETLRGSENGPRNDQGRFNPLPELAVPGTDISRTIRDAWRGRKFFNHMTAAQARNRLPREVWDSYFKFCFERNPWDKTLSSFHWQNRNRVPPRTLPEFLACKDYKSDLPVYTIGGELAVDFVGRYETLQDDLNKVAAKLGLEGDLELPRAKGGYRKDARHYRDVFTEEQRAIVASKYAREIELFGYEY